MLLSKTTTVEVVRLFTVYVKYLMFFVTDQMMKQYCKYGTRRLPQDQISNVHHLSSIGW